MVVVIVARRDVRNRDFKFNKLMDTIKNKMSVGAR